MKTKIQFLLALLFIASLRVFSQEHSIIQNLEVVFKSPPEPNQKPDSILVFPQAAIILKTTDNVSKVHFRIKDRTNSEVIFQTAYSLSSPESVDESGFILFQRTGTNFIIGSVNRILLKTYLCEILTEDNNANLSEPFSKIQ